MADQKKKSPEEIRQLLQNILMMQAPKPPPEEILKLAVRCKRGPTIRGPNKKTRASAHTEHCTAAESKSPREMGGDEKLAQSLGQTERMPHGTTMMMTDEELKKYNYAQERGWLANHPDRLKLYRERAKARRQLATYNRLKKQFEADKSLVDQIMASATPAFRAAQSV
jgi:alcohol dehydrogenase class IV